MQTHFLIFVVCFVIPFIECSPTCKSSFTIKDDPSLDETIAKVRAEFLATRPTPVTRLDVSLLIPNGDGSWRQGTYNPYEIAYPASCVKLAYLASAMQFCNESGLPPTCLQNNVNLMIMNSDNLQTGIVVDSITGTINNRSWSDPNATEFVNWMQKRRYASDYLDSIGLLGNQIVLSKTYPTNSGQGPNGGEQLIIDLYGGNRMNPLCTSYLMLEIVKGALHPEARDYMMGILFHRRWDAYTSFGFGLPPGSVMYNKIGDAYNDLNEISYIVLPNGNELVLSVFSDGLELSNPSPYDTSNLGVFAEMLINATGLADGNPPLIILDTNSPSFQTKGQWQTVSNQNDMYGTSCMQSSDPDGVATWNVNLEEGGLYEVAVWYPQDQSFSSHTPLSVLSLDGPDNQSINQRVMGGRWVYLGDYDFAQGMNPTLVTISNPGNAATIVANAIKLTRWPYCNGIPGSACIPNQW